AIVAKDLGVDLQHEPGAGAAGGLGFGLLAFCGATLRPGVDGGMGTVGLPERGERAGIGVTGEGALDAPAPHSQVPECVRRAAAVRAGGIAVGPVAVGCGRATVRPPGIIVRSLVERVGPDRAFDDPLRSVELVVEEVAGEVALGVTR